MSIDAAYEKFKQDQIRKAQEAGVASAYAPTPEPVQTQNVTVANREPAYIDEGGRIGTKAAFEAEAESNRLQSLKQRADQARDLRAQGYTLTGHDAQGNSIYTKLPPQVQGPPTPADIARRNEVGEYDPLTQIKRGLVDYNVESFTGLAGQIGDLTGNKGLKDAATSTDNFLGVDRNRPAVGPIKTLIDLGELGLANLTGDRKGQVEAKQKLAYDFDAAKQRPFEYAASSVGDVAGLFVGTTEAKAVGKAGAQGVSKGLDLLSGIVSKGGDATHYIPSVLKPAYAEAEAAGAVKVLPQSGKSGSSALSSLADKIQSLTPTGRKLDQAQQKIQTVFPDSRGFQKIGSGRAIFDVALEEQTGASKYIGGLVDVNQNELRLATRTPQDAKTLGKTADSPFTNSVTDVRMRETTGLKPDRVTPEGDIIDSSGKVRPAAEPRSIGAIESYKLDSMLSAMPPRPQTGLYGDELSAATKQGGSGLGGVGGASGRKAGGSVLDLAPAPATAAEQKALDSALLDSGPALSPSVGSAESADLLAKSGSVGMKMTPAFADESAPPTEQEPQQDTQAIFAGETLQNKKKKLFDLSDGTGFTSLATPSQGITAVGGGSLLENAPAVSKARGLDLNPLLGLDVDNKALQRETGLNLLQSPTKNLIDSINDKTTSPFVSMPKTTPTTGPRQTPFTTPTTGITTIPDPTTTTIPKHDNPLIPSEGGSIFTPHRMPPALTFPRGGGGGGLFGFGGGREGGTKTRGLSVINPLAPSFSIRGEGRRESPLGFSGAFGKKRGSSGGNVFGTSTKKGKGIDFGVKGDASVFGSSKHSKGANVFGVGSKGYSFGRSKKGGSIWS